MDLGQNQVVQKENKTMNYLVFGIAVLVMAIAIVQVFQMREISSLKKITASAVSVQSISNTGKIDMTGWSADEKMMYEHHGTLPSRLQGGQPAPSTMAGGC